MPVLSQLGRKDRNAPEVLPKLEQPPEQTGFFQNVSAGFTAAKAGPHSTQNARAIYESRYYDQIIQALAAEGEHATDMVPSPVRADSPFYHPVEGEQRLPDGRVLIPAKRGFANPFSEGPSLTRDVNPVTNFFMGGDSGEQGQIDAAVGRVRQRKPDFLKWYKGTASIDTMAKAARLADLQRAGDVTSRATTMGKIGAFIGGAGGSLASGDPENFVGAFTSPVAEAAGKSVARQVIRHATEGAAVNAAAGVLAVPGQEADSEALTGQHMTAGDMAKSVGENALVGSLFGTAHVVAPIAARGAGRVGSAITDKVVQSLPAGARDPILAASIRAGTIKDRGLLYEFQKLHNPYAAVDTSTPTEKAAAHVMMRDIETQEQSPLQPAHAPVNNDRLSAVASSLGMDIPAPDVPTAAPVQTPTVRDREAGGRKPASFVDGINAAEGSTRNPRSSADGYGNFIDSTWLSVAPKVTDTTGMNKAEILALRHDKTIAGKATEYYAAQNGRYLRIRGLEDSPGNLSLAHFLGPADAAKVLQADPHTPVESILPANVVHANHEVLQGKSADQVVAWAHKRIGAAVDQPPARPDAVADEGFDYSSPVAYSVEMLRPHDVQTDAALMQYKSGGDQNGVTDALKGVEQWNPLLSQQILAWERTTGERIVVDGHQRVGLAKRLAGQDDNIQLPTVIVREADGITAAQARVLGALRNIANGTGTLLDNAKVLRDAPEGAAMLPSNSALARESIGLSRLSYPAFGAVVNDIIPAHIAAQIGLHAGDTPESHMAMVDLLRRERIASPSEAGAIVRQARNDGFATADEQQLSMLGDIPQQSLYVPIARIMAAASKRLREEKRTFKVLSDKAGKIEAAGNVLDRTANESKVVGNDEALAILDRTAHRSGPVREALIRAARAELSGTRRADAVGQFLDELGSIDLRAAAAGVESDGRAGAAPVGEGRDFAPETANGDVSAGSEPSLFDQSVAARQSAEQFSDPHGSEAKAQTALLEHDLRPKPVEAPQGAKAAEDASGAVLERHHLFDLKSTGFRLSEEGEKPQSIEEILKAADANDAAAEALRGCL